MAHGTWVTVELRDGTALAGLGAPAGGSMWRRRCKNGEAIELPDDFVITDAKDLLAVSGRYARVEN